MQRTTRAAGMLAAILLLFSLAWACTPEAAEVDANEMAGSLQYGQDPRTGLCYAMAGYKGYGFTGLALTSVPCTPEVLALARAR